MSPGQLIVGAVLSTTVTVNVQVEVLPAASVAVATTVVFPTGKKLPDVGKYVIVGVPAQSSVAVALLSKFTTAPHWPASLLAVTLPAHTIVGGVASNTVIVNEHDVELPATSVAVYITV